MPPVGSLHRGRTKSFYTQVETHPWFRGSCPQFTRGEAEARRAGYVRSGHSGRPMLKSPQPPVGAGQPRPEMPRVAQVSAHDEEGLFLAPRLKVRSRVPGRAALPPLPGSGVCHRVADGLERARVWQDSTSRSQGPRGPRSIPGSLPSPGLELSLWNQVLRDRNAGLAGAPEEGGAAAHLFGPAPSWRRPSRHLGGLLSSRGDVHRGGAAPRPPPAGSCVSWLPAAAPAPRLRGRGVCVSEQNRKQTVEHSVLRCQHGLRESDTPSRCTVRRQSAGMSNRSGDHGEMCGKTLIKSLSVRFYLGDITRPRPRAPLSVGSRGTHLFC